MALFQSHGTEDLCKWAESPSANSLSANCGEEEIQSVKSGEFRMMRAFLQLRQSWKSHQCPERVAFPALLIIKRALRGLLWHSCFTEQASERRRVWKSAAKSFFTCSDSSWVLKVFFPCWFFSLPVELIFKKNCNRKCFWKKYEKQRHIYIYTFIYFKMCFIIFVNKTHFAYLLFMVFVFFFYDQMNPALDNTHFHFSHFLTAPWQVSKHFCPSFLDDTKQQL